MISVYPLALAALCVLPFVIEAQRDLTLTLNRISQSESPNAKCIDGEFNFNHFSPSLPNLVFLKKNAPALYSFFTKQCRRDRNLLCIRTHRYCACILLEVRRCVDQIRRS